jgi:hypothetical protein
VVVLAHDTNDLRRPATLVACRLGVAGEGIHGVFWQSYEGYCTMVVA